MKPTKSQKSKAEGRKSKAISIASIRRLNLKPGEVLVFTVPSAKWNSHTARLTEQRLQILLPEGVKSLVMSDECNLKVLSFEQLNELSMRIQNALVTPPSRFESQLLRSTAKYRLFCERCGHEEFTSSESKRSIECPSERCKGEFTLKRSLNPFKRNPGDGQ